MADILSAATPVWLKNIVRRPKPSNTALPRNVPNRKPVLVAHSAGVFMATTPQDKDPIYGPCHPSTLLSMPDLGKSAGPSSSRFSQTSPTGEPRTPFQSSLDPGPRSHLLREGSQQADIQNETTPDDANQQGQSRYLEPRFSGSQKYMKSDGELSGDSTRRKPSQPMHNHGEQPLELPANSTRAHVPLNATQVAHIAADRAWPAPTIAGSQSQARSRPNTSPSEGNRTQKQTRAPSVPSERAIKTPRGPPVSRVRDWSALEADGTGQVETSHLDDASGDEEQAEPMAPPPNQPQEVATAQIQSQRWNLLSKRPPAHTGAPADWEAQVKDFLKSYKVTKKQPGFDWLGTLITWVPSELKRCASIFHEDQLKLQARLAAAESSSHDLEGQIRQRDEEIRHKNKSMSVLLVERDMARGERDTARERESQNYIGWETSAGKLSQATVSIKYYQAQNAGLNQDLANLNASLQQSQAQNAGLNQDLANLNASLQQSQAQNAGLNQDLANLNASLQQSQAQSAELNQDLANLNASLQQSQAQNAGLNQDLANLDASLQRSQAQNAGLNQDLANLNASLQQSHTHVASVDTQLRSAVNKYRIAKSELSRANDTIQDMLGQLEQAGRREEQLESEKDQLIRGKEILEQENRNAMEELAKEVQGLTDELERAKMKHADAIGRLHSHYESQISHLTAQHADDMGKLQASIDSKIERATKKSHDIIKGQKIQIASYSSGSYVPIADDAFSRSFDTLVQDVKKLASQVHRPPTYDFDPALDQTDCLGRHADQASWIWPRFVRNVCWQVLIGAFFSLPYGFGCLGRQGEGYGRLYPFYEALSRADPDDESGLTLDIPNDKEVNVFRASIFEKILAAVRSRDGAETEFSLLFQANVERAAGELCDILQHLANGRLDAACAQQAAGVAHRFGILALEMGSQRARVVLETCQYRDGARQDEWLKEDSDSFGANWHVSLMTHPCLSRVGDGRADLHKKKIIVKGEFVPLKLTY